MDKSKTLFFTGHRDMYRTEGSDAFEILRAAIIAFIGRGYEYFVAGGAIGFDTMAAECVLKLKNEYPQIKLVLMLPCKNQTIKWSVWEAKKHDRILRAADEVIYISQEYSRDCMLKRDRAMADASSACIAYCTKSSGGTAYTVSYALKQCIPVTNLAIAL